MPPVCLHPLLLLPLGSGVRQTQARAKESSQLTFALPAHLWKFDPLWRTEQVRRAMAIKVLISTTPMLLPIAVLPVELHRPRLLW